MAEEEKGEEEGEGETEITMEELYESLKAAAIVVCFEKVFGPVPHPLRIFKFRRWVRDFEAFQKGVECGEMLMRKRMPREVQRDIREVEIDD